MMEAWRGVAWRLGDFTVGARRGIDGGGLHGRLGMVEILLWMLLA